MQSDAKSQKGKIGQDEAAATRQYVNAADAERAQHAALTAMQGAQQGIVAAKLQQMLINMAVAQQPQQQQQQQQIRQNQAVARQYLLGSGGVSAGMGSMLPMSLAPSHQAQLPPPPPPVPTMPSAVQPTSSQVPAQLAQLFGTTDPALWNILCALIRDEVTKQVQPLRYELAQLRGAKLGNLKDHDDVAHTDQAFEAPPPPLPHPPPPTTSTLKHPPQRHQHHQDSTGVHAGRVEKRRVVSKSTNDERRAMRDFAESIEWKSGTRDVAAWSTSPYAEQFKEITLAQVKHFIHNHKKKRNQKVTEQKSGESA